MNVEPYPYRASAWWEGQVVAESDSCLHAESPGESPVLYFPKTDVELAQAEEATEYLQGSDHPDLSGYLAVRPGAGPAAH